MHETDLGHNLPLWSVAFFVLQLLAIAILPLTHEHFWEKNRNKAIISAILCIPVIILFGYLGDFNPILHELLEYFSFIILLGSLFVVSGGIYLSGDITAKPMNNTIFLAIGAVLANIVGTTGASMLLIRPMLRTNHQRKHIFHIPIFFIFIVSNIGGCLTPIGDPPLFMGYLKGVPFFWTLRLFPEWLFMMALILTVFYLLDRRYWAKESLDVKIRDVKEFEPVRVSGWINVAFIAVILFSVIKLGTPFREIAMIAASALSLWFTKKEIRKKNLFNWAPIVEVAVLFAGIFITMVPALLILKARGGELGVTEPWQFFWASGLLSSFLDNTPTYLAFFSLSQGLAITANLAKDIVGIPTDILVAISLGSVFMGANTYIGNGPNFMVKVICEHSGFKMPSFFGYMVWSGLILIPLFVIVTFVFLVF